MYEQTTALWRRLTRGTPVPCPDTQDERRSHMRFALDLPAAVVPAATPDAPPVPVRIRDISLGGVSLTAAVSFPIGTMLTLSLPHDDAEPAVDVLACVVYLRQDEPDAWVLGCNFSRDLDPEDLAPLGVAVPFELRAAKRYPCDVRADVQRALDEDAAPWRARAANLSLAGVALVTEHDIAPGTLLTVELHSLGGTGRRTILACVVHATVRPDGLRTLGCNFIRELSEDDLKALV